MLRIKKVTVFLARNSHAQTAQIERLPCHSGEIHHNSSSHAVCPTIHPVTLFAPQFIQSCCLPHSSSGHAVCPTIHPVMLFAPLFIQSCCLPHSSSSHAVCPTIHPVMLFAPHFSMCAVCPTFFHVCC